MAAQQADPDFLFLQPEGKTQKYDAKVPSEALGGCMRQNCVCSMACYSLKCSKFTKIHTFPNILATHSLTR